MIGYHRFRVGSFACTSLFDGFHEYKWQDFFANAPEREVRFRAEWAFVECRAVL
jgi:hypothetical protein